MITLSPNGDAPTPPRPLTPEEARTVSLSWHPFKRLGQLAEYGAGFYDRQIDDTPLPGILTRHGLVKWAEDYELAQKTVEELRDIPD